MRDEWAHELHTGINDELVHTRVIGIGTPAEAVMIPRDSRCWGAKAKLGVAFIVQQLLLHLQTCRTSVGARFPRHHFPEIPVSVSLDCARVLALPTPNRIREKVMEARHATAYTPRSVIRGRETVERADRTGVCRLIDKIALIEGDT